MKIKLLLFIFFTNVVLASASHIDTLRVESNCMNKSIPNLVILPDSYANQKEQFPVLYLLHGATGDFKDWLKKVPDLAKYADLYNFIIVCPDGGFTSWYFDSPVDPAMKYETYISQELVAQVDQSYPTIKGRHGRAISGLSMGGHGAFYLAFRHQDIWGAAGSTSGGLDIRPFPNNWDLSKRLGIYADNQENWEKNTVINQVHLLDGKKLKLIFDCGIDDFFYDANNRMHELLLERNIPHDYTARPGKHNNEYWANSIKYQLLFFSDFFHSGNEGSSKN
ncbi:alpha/beta hydrolase [Mangrovibacterium sp.]|uniref:alpha/beta hydrolase n=1 Tax=Mangrovibacterium sp. TaxID=1961364 RepID=UPI003561DF1B